MSSEILFLVNYQSDFNGIFSDMNKAIISILSQLPSKNFLDFNIQSIYNNSNLREKTYYFKEEEEMFCLYNQNTKLSNKILENYNLEFNTDLEVQNENSVELNSEEEKELEEIKSKQDDIQHKINLLKKDKEKLEEMKSVYEVDKELYFKFKGEFESNEDFTIPEMFEQKYKIFRELDEKDEINWDNFHAMYKPEVINHSYNALFFYEGIDEQTDSEDSSDSN